MKKIELGKKIQTGVSGDGIEFINNFKEKWKKAMLEPSVFQNGSCPYILALGENPSITCMTCGKTSYNSNDIEKRYCGFCNKFHKDE